MIVHCQTCDTDFKLDESSLPPEGAWVRCSVCGEVFHVAAPEQAAAKATLRAPAEKAQDAAETETKPKDKTAAARRETGPPPPPALPFGPTPLDLHDYQDVDQQRAQELADFGLGGHPEEPLPGRSSLFKALFWIIGLALLVAITGLGGVVVLDRMGLEGSLMQRAKSLPGLAPLLGQPQTAATRSEAKEEPVRMTLSQVQRFFRENDTAGRIFLIQGLVENQHNKPRAAVLVQGRLYDSQGKLARQATSYAGAVLTPGELRHLSLAAIERRLSSPLGPDGNKYVVGPGQSIPFMIVLANLPNHLVEFTAEVVASEPAPATGGAR